jgi:RNA polymerase sigma factor (TIGR02999 family)
MNDVTLLLNNAAEGDTASLNRLYEQVYSELRAIAVRKMAAERPGHTLQATALVNEAYLRLGGSGAIKFENRAHFFGAAAEAMRRILIERARRRLAAKRGAGAEALDMDELEIASPPVDDDRLLAINEALDKLAALDPSKAELVKLRYFVGLDFNDAAAALGISVPTAKRWWAYARVWLGVEMRGEPPG